MPRLISADLRDIPALVALKRAAVAAAYSDLPPAAVEHWQSRFATPEYFTDRLANQAQPTQFFMSGSRRTPTGIVSLGQRPDGFHIGDLYVRTPSRGIGSALLDHAIALAAERGASSVLIDVLGTNDRARALYERRGFAKVSEYMDTSLEIQVERLELQIGLETP